jgi:hypothetical protein
MDFSLYRAQSSDVPSVGLTVRLVLVLMHRTRRRVTHETKKFQLSFMALLYRQVFESSLKG